MSEFAVGVDGGGTRTRAMAVDSAGAALGRGVAGAALLQAHNTEHVARKVEEAARAAAADAGLTLPSSALFAGVAGAGRPALRLALEVALKELGVAAHVAVDTDISIAVRDGLEERPGILLLSGTGSMAWGRGPDGREARVGGWGAVLGDEGSGYDMGLAGLRAVVRARDGRGPSTALTEALLEATGVGSPEGLVSWAEAAEKAQVAALAPRISELASSDDASRAITEGAAAELAHHVRALRDRLGPWEGDVEVVLAGGILSPDEPARDAVAALLSAEGFRVSDRVVDPARGAATLALGLLD